MVTSFHRIAVAASFAGVLFLSAFGATLIAAEPLQQGPSNLIREEMIALDSALKVTMDALVLNEPARILPAFQETNRLRHQVEQAVQGGAQVILPRNQKRFREFVRLDDKFHRDLEFLLKAARKNDMRAVQRQTHRLLDACVRCHAIFRK